MSKQSAKELKKSFILLMSLLFVLTCAAVAWFIDISRGNMDNAGFDSVDAIKSDVSTTGGYYNGIDLSELGLDVVLRPVSGSAETGADGRVQLYTPVIAPFTEAEPIEGAGSWQQDTGIIDYDYTARKAYVSYIDYYTVIRSNQQAKLALSSESSVVPIITDPNGTDEERPDRKIKSDYGDFSVDNIAGAVRVAFIVCTPDDPAEVTGELAFDNEGRLCRVITYEEETGLPDEFEPVAYTEQLMLIWVPNDRYQLTQQFTDVSGRGDMVLTGASFNPNGAAEPAYYYYNGSGGVSQYAAGAYCTSGLLQTDGYALIADSIWYNAFQEEYCACIKIRIWVEGYDREASTALAEGMFDPEIYLLTIKEES